MLVHTVHTEKRSSRSSAALHGRMHPWGMCIYILQLMYCFTPSLMVASTRACVFVLVDFFHVNTSHAVVVVFTFETSRSLSMVSSIYYIRLSQISPYRTCSSNTGCGQIPWSQQSRLTNFQGVPPLVGRKNVNLRTWQSKQRHRPQTKTTRRQQQGYT